MHNELTELVFEGLDEHTALELSKEILGGDVTLPTSTEGACDNKIARVEIGGGVVLHNAHLRVLRYDQGVFDVELNFLPAEVNSPESLMARVHEFSIRLSNAHGVKSFYAGLEPASDEDTRFFTGAVPGPYM